MSKRSRASEEIFFEEEDDASTTTTRTETDPDDEIVMDNEIEIVPSRTTRLEGLITGKRGRIAGVLAVALAGVTAFLMLRENGPGGKELMGEYDRIAGVKKSNKKEKVKLKDPKLRHQFVLEQVAAGNMPSTYDDFVTVEAKGKKGTIVRFKVAPHGLRIGHDDDWIEVPLDGPYAMAAAEILGYNLPTTWMVEATYRQAIKKDKDKDKEDKEEDDDDKKGKKSKEGASGKVKFFAAPEIAKELGLQNWNPNEPDGWWQQSPQFIRQRNKLLHEWLEENDIEDDQLISGYAKEVCTPYVEKNKRLGFFSFLGGNKDDKKQKVRLEFFGGYYENGSPVQGLSGGIHPGYYADYSHIVRFTESDELEVQKAGSDDTETLTYDEFHNDADYALEFGFNKTNILKRGYPYYPVLKKWMKENGYLNEDYDPVKEKKENKKDKKDSKKK